MVEERMDLREGMHIFPVTVRRDSVVRIEGNGRTIEMTLREIRGIGIEKTAYFEVKGYDERDEVHLNQCDGLVPFSEGISLIMKHVKHNSNRRVRINYLLSADYFGSIIKP